MDEFERERAWQEAAAARAAWTPAAAEREREVQAELEWQRGMAEAVREEGIIRAAIDRDEAERELRARVGNRVADLLAAREMVPDVPSFIGPNPIPNRVPEH